MNDEQLERYSRHILLANVGVEGQQNIADAHVLIMGLGGLGSPAAIYIAAAGIGRMTVIDDDVVDASNLSRQIIHKEKNLGAKKTDSAIEHLLSLNGGVDINSICSRPSETEFYRLLDDVDVVLDCSDSMDTRKLVNLCCFDKGVPLISGAAIRFEGQLSVFDFRLKSSPCYECLYSTVGEENLSCSQRGVFSPLVGIVGSMQALEALKLLVGFECKLVGKLALFDGLRNHWSYFRFEKKETCLTCSNNSAEARAAQRY